MRIYGFDWDEYNLEHISRHGVRDYEVEEVILFGNPISQRSRDNTYVAYGVTQDGRYLLIVFVTKAHSLIRAITARDMTNREKHN
ncbi:MAG: BrnT family toxin, partial [Candidatus Omnitrophica bacterium]|nr:BrnT family toxin [Candidatus Omnitrophota bacterium]